MKYADVKIVFREVPDEITLAVNISGCPVGCKGCHSPYLAGDVGEPLDAAALDRLIASNPGITCVSLMGGDADPAYVGQLCRHLKEQYPGLKTCWYSGRLLDRAGDVLPWLDFIKVGPWIEEFGPLDSPTTNQRFYAIFHDPAPAQRYATTLPGGDDQPSAPAPAEALPAGAYLPAGIRLEDRTSRLRKIVF